MRYLFIIVLVLVALPVLAQISDEELLTELTEILTLQERGLQKIEQGLSEQAAGLIELRAGLAQSEAAQTILTRQLTDLETSFQSYESQSEATIAVLEGRTRLLTYGLIGSLVVAVFAFISAVW